VLDEVRLHCGDLALMAGDLLREDPGHISPALRSAHFAALLKQLAVSASSGACTCA
jgi:hypothetical protein